MKIANYKSRFSLVAVLVMVAILGLLAAFTPPASAQVTDSTLTAATNLPAIIQAGKSTNIITGGGSYIKLGNQIGLGVSWKFNASAGTSNAVVQFCSTVDGTNYSTVPWDSITNAANSTTDVVLIKNWSAAQLSGLKGLGVLYIDSGNNGILTNKSFMWRRPN